MTTISRDRNGESMKAKSSLVPCMKSMARIIILLSFFLCAGSALAQGTLQVADLGDYALENGQIIKECRLAYRTFGALNADKSNVVLFPTWFYGTTQELIDLGLIGPGKLADSSKYFVIAVDAFGNGVSSSPSNSTLQPERTFPRFSIKDMVNVQHLLLTHHLHVPRLHAIIGISMGGMAAFQWMVSYPDLMDKAVVIAGTPRLTSYDRLFWQAEISAIDTLKSDDPNVSASAEALAAMHYLHLRTPRNVNDAISPESYQQFLKSLEDGIMKYNFTNWSWQLKAILGHDIFKAFGNAMEEAAKVVRAKSLIIWAQQDLAVNSDPARAFAKMISAETLMLGGDCGHLAFLCEGEVLRDSVKRFLDE
jgi:homoserine O-acetyltransferase/O-succinyltransferase